MTSMKDVARKAGVSESTVSRVLSQKIPVKEETRQKVLAAVEELGYRPNYLAQSLRRRKSMTFALLVPDISAPPFSAIASAAERAAHSHGYSLMLCNTLEDADREEHYLTLVGQKWADGVIFSRVQDEDAVIDVLSKKRIPMVVIDRALMAETMPSVVVDNEQVGRLATEHLLGLGHHVIGCIAAPRQYRFARERLRGYRQALEEAGIPVDPSLVAEGTIKAESGYEAARTLLSTRHDITAVYAFCDIRAIHCMRAARERGLSVPEDISIIGTNNTSICELVQPSLTTIAQPFERMATEAVEMLIQLAEGNWLKTRQVVLEPDLVLRATTGPAPVLAQTLETAAH